VIPFLVEIYPIDCTIVSEEDNNIIINLNKRRSDALEGQLKKGNSVIGKFFTSKPKLEKPAKWRFHKNNRRFEGEIILFKDNYLWHPFQNKIKSENINRVIFSGLAYSLNSIFNDRDLLKASSGFFNIGYGCYGGRIKNG
tara:strand:+ start:386 stop:805 length:420 start_codon:yes stop_codon:yes gene_type:complete